MWPGSERSRVARPVSYSAPRPSFSTSLMRHWRRLRRPHAKWLPSSPRYGRMVSSRGVTRGSAACGRIVRDAITLARIKRVVEPAPPHRAEAPLFTYRGLHSGLPAVVVDVEPCRVRPPGVAGGAIGGGRPPLGSALCGGVRCVGDQTRRGRGTASGRTGRSCPSARPRFMTRPAAQPSAPGPSPPLRRAQSPGARRLGTHPRSWSARPPGRSSCPNRIPLPRAPRNPASGGRSG